MKKECCNKILFIVLLLFIGSALMAELSVEAYVNKTKIGMEDLLKYTVEISGKNAGSVAKPNVAKFRNFTLLNTSSSSSQKMSIVNGKMDKSITKSFTYTLRAKKTGNLLIPPITIKYKNEKATTSPIRITVQKESTAPAPPVSNNLQSNKSSSKQFSDNLFVLTEIDKSTVYKDEPVIVNYKLYTKYDIANLSYGENPNFNDFWKEDIKRADKLEFTRKSYNGTLFNTMVMLSVALYPTKSGTLIIPPLELIIDIRTKQKSFFDFGSTKRYNVSSKSRALNVKPLPEANRPPSFNGAVGRFQLEADISNSKLKVGESFTYSMRIKGSGNLQHFEPPKLSEISNLRFIDPEITTNLGSNRVSGTKSIKYLVIAQEKGNFELPGLAFTYFDTKQKRYITKRTPSFNITVEEGDQTFVGSLHAQSQVQREGKDIGFIVRSNHLKHQSLLFNKFFFWLAVFIFLMTIPLSVNYANEKYKLQDNYNYQRQKLANKILKKYMKQATVNFNKNSQDFYPTAQNGLNNYLADKLKINRGSSTEILMEEIGKTSIDEEVLQKLKEFFNKCNQARFMPGGFDPKNMKEDFQLLHLVLSSLSKIRF